MPRENVHDTPRRQSIMTDDFTLESVSPGSENPPTEKISIDEPDFNQGADRKAPPNSADSDFPDGGLRAWIIVFGAMCNTFSTFGYVNSWGVFQAYYQTTILSDSSPSEIAWIGSLQYSLVFLPGLIVGRLFDLGYFRSVFLTCSALLVLSTFLIAQCTQYWHFLVCQGIVVGLAAGGIYGPTTAVVSHWFKRRRGLAMGYVAIGASLGGTILPITTRRLIPMIGFPWTIRVVGFILLLTSGMANLTLKRRLPPRDAPGGLLNLRAFRSAPYTTYCISSFIVFLGIYTVLTYIDVCATALGISPRFCFYLVSIANASSLFGRYTSGLLCDRIGPMNVMIPFTAIAGILTYAWPFAKTQAALIVVTIFYGFTSGCYVSLLSNPMMDMGDTDDVGRRVGMFGSILALGALGGPPISGAIYRATGRFEEVGYYAGSCVLLGVGVMCISRHLVLRRLIGKF